MPTSDGHFKGISVPRLPWLEEKEPPVAEKFWAESNRKKDRESRPGQWRIATGYDCQPSRARGVLRYIARGLWDRPPAVMLENEEGPHLWRFDYATGRYLITTRRSRGELE